MFSRPRLLRAHFFSQEVEGDRVYVRWYIAFHVLFALLALTALAFSVSNPDTSRGDELMGAVILAVWAALFWMGGWAFNHPDKRRTLLFLGSALVLLPIMLRIDDSYGLLIFMAYWHGFSFLRVPWALVYATLLSFVVQIGFNTSFWQELRTFDVSIQSLLIGVIILTVSGLMAAYMEAFAREADRRSRLLAELRAAQDKLAEQERVAGMEQERQRIAAEIHDTIAQHFTSIVTNLQAAETRAQTSPGAAHEHIGAALESARLGIADARSMVSTMQPDILRGGSLVDALHHVLTNSGVNGTSRLNVHGEQQPLDRAHETILLRGLQEALTNIRKHAKASRVGVTMTWLDDEVLLDITDNGVGFCPDDVPASVLGEHVGLRTMRARVESAGGTWAVESDPGEGTSLAISFPIPVTSEAADA